MDKVKTEKIKCLNSSCKKWINSPVGSTSNKVQCPHCGRMTDLHKENIKNTAEDGGISGKDTI